jgi:hypothetical protein
MTYNDPRHRMWKYDMPLATYICFSTKRSPSSIIMQLFSFVFASRLAVVMSIIACPAAFAAALTLPERDNSNLRNECGAPCTTTCYSQYGGGPNINDCVSLVNTHLLPNRAHHFTVYIWKFGSPTAVDPTTFNSAPDMNIDHGSVIYTGTCRSYLSQLTSTGFTYCSEDWVGDCAFRRTFVSTTLLA